jgi:predicted dehydrogenase
MGTQHATEWTKRSDAELVAVFDVMEERSAKFSEEFGAKAYDSFQEAVEAPDVHVVSVCTPVADHAEIAIHAMEQGKHVLCEKPIALTMEQARRMKDTAERTGVKLGVSLQYRDRVQNRRFRKLFDEGEFGEHLFLRYVDLREVRPKPAMHQRSKNGGPVIDMAGHFFDLGRFITSNEPESVRATGYVFGRGKKRLAGIEDPAVDAADIQVQYTGGHTLSLLVDWGMPEGYPGFGEELLVGSKLSVRSLPDQTFEAHFSDRTEHWDSFRSHYGPVNPGGRIEDLLHAIEEDREPSVSAADAMTALGASLAALESVKNGTPVAVST